MRSLQTGELAVLQAMISDACTHVLYVQRHESSICMVHIHSCMAEVKSLYTTNLLSFSTPTKRAIGSHNKAFHAFQCCRGSYIGVGLLSSELDTYAWLTIHMSQVGHTGWSVHCTVYMYAVGWFT